MIKLTTKNDNKIDDNLLTSKIYCRVTDNEKIKFQNKAKRMHMSASKMLRDLIKYSDKLQYLFSHDDAQQFSVSLNRLNGQVNRMSYELNRTNNHAGFLSSNTLEEVKDLLNEVGEKYDEILTAIYGNVQPTKVAPKKEKISLPSYASEYTKDLAKRLEDDRKKLADAIANNADPEERRMLQDYVTEDEDNLQRELRMDKGAHNASKREN